MPYTAKKKIIFEKEDVEEMVYDAFQLWAHNEFKGLETAALICLLYKTGARISEIVALQREDFRLTETDLWVRIRNLKRKKFIETELPLPIYEDEGKNFFNHIIIKHVKQFNKGERVFDFLRWTGWHRVTQVLNEAYPHLFRHTKATKMANKGANEFELRKWFGWAKTSSMPANYVDTSNIQLKKITGLGED